MWVDPNPTHSNRLGQLCGLTLDHVVYIMGRVWAGLASDFSPLLSCMLSLKIYSFPLIVVIALGECFPLYKDSFGG